jgi:hypothetical protein
MPVATVTGSAGPTINFTQVSAVGIGSSVNLPILSAFKSQFRVSGGNLDQCDTIYAKTLNFVASTPQTLDLTTLTDVVGNAISFARVRLIAFRVHATTDGWMLLVGDSVTNEWDGLCSAGATVKVYSSTAINDAFVLFQMPNTTGAAVSPTTKTLKLDPGANALGLVDVIIVGCAE